MMLFTKPLNWTLTNGEVRAALPCTLYLLTLVSVNVPGYKFSSVGSTLITIDSVQDSSPCSQAELDSLKSSLWVDVAETAAIVPFDRREDYCEGDILSFQLEGTPPWTVR